MAKFHRLAQRGVRELAQATPRDSGITADSWGYEIRQNGSQIEIWWTNDNIVDGSYNVAIGIQYGHGTGTGAYVEGEDYINPTLKPIFDEISNAVWEEVQRL
jgi:hypothetical protein